MRDVAIVSAAQRQEGAISTESEAEFVTPPDIAYVVRVTSKSNANAVKALAEEIVPGVPRVV